MVSAIATATIGAIRHLEEMYSYTLSIFDCWGGHPAEMREFQAKMKRAWAQQKFRANLKGKKQSTLVLTVKAKTQLQEMAELRNVNLNDMLEHIIKKEYQSRKVDPTKK